MRLMGIEKEYPITGERFDYSALEVSTAIRATYPGALHKDGHILWLQSGAKLYSDVGDNYEQATAECEGPLDVVVAENSGDLIMADAVTALQNNSEAAGEDLQIFLLNRVTDSRKTNGYHINLQGSRFDGISKDEAFDNLAALYSLMVSGTWLFGSGNIRSDAEQSPIYFSTSQKAFDIHKITADGTTTDKPLISRRDQPHADNKIFRRYHLVGNDALHSPWQSWLRLGIYSLAVELAEKRPDISSRFRRVLPSFLNESLDYITRSSESNVPFRAENGDFYDVVDLQEMVFDAVQKALQAGDMIGDLYGGDEHEKVMSEWEWAIDQMRNPSEDFDELIDWRKRRNILMPHLEAGAPAVKVRALDIALDAIGRPKTEALFRAPLQAAGWERLAKVYQLDTDGVKEEIQLRQFIPSSQKASERSKIIIGANGRYRIVAMDWESCKVRMPNKVDSQIEVFRARPYHISQQ